MTANHTPQQAANTIREALGKPAREATGEDGITLVYTDAPDRNNRVIATTASRTLSLR